MLKLIAFAAVAGLFLFAAPAGHAQNSMRGMDSGNWKWGPETCVRVQFIRSRQTRYGGAPRCRRIRADANVAAVTV